MEMKTKKSLERDEISLKNISIEKIFETNRFQEQQYFLKLILYFPIGILLLLLRLAIVFLACLLFPILPWNRSFIVKGVCKALGLYIQYEDKHFNKNTKIFVANHVSIIDRLAVNFLIPSKTITNYFNLKDVNILSFWKDGDNLSSREVLSTNDSFRLKRYIEESAIPVLNFPEGATTSGKIGLLKFNPSIFSLNLPIQPILIHISVSSFINISPSVLGSKTWSDILWLFFIPYTLFSLKILPSMVKSPEEDALDFSKRVQEAMASSLNVIPTVYTAKDKYELVKRMSSSVAVRNDSLRRNPTIEISKSSMHQNLEISNQSELKYMPKLDTAAKTFGKSPKERMQSYQERKAALIHSARLKYLENHGFFKK